MLIDKTRLIRDLSPERLTTYLQMTDGDVVAGLRRYELNQQLSEALYVPLQNLEIGLRNGLHRAFSARHGSSWFDGPFPFKPWQAIAVREAKAKRQRQSKPDGHGGIIAELHFGFWTTLFDPEFDHPIWHKGYLKQVFRHPPPDAPGLNRRMFSGPLNEIRKLRNRVFHHEPILKILKVHATHQSLCRILGMLSPDLLAWNQSNDRFPATYAACRAELNRGCWPVSDPKTCRRP